MRMRPGGRSVFNEKTCRPAHRGQGGGERVRSGGSNRRAALIEAHPEHLADRERLDAAELLEL